MPISAVERLFDTQLSQASPEALRLEFIQIARRGIAEFIARQPDKPTYTIEVNGAQAATEYSLPVGPGKISYKINRIKQIARYALTVAVAISPVRSGRYKSSWFLLADNIRVTNFNTIPESVQELVLTNDQPYARKIHRRGVPPGIVEKVRQFVIRKYGTFVSANVEFHTIRGGYILKTNTKRHRAGERMTYPSLVMRPKYY